jgi:hypothetical protein
MAQQTLWTAEKLSIVKNLLVSQKLTHAAIAERIGVSRSSINHCIQHHGLVGLAQRRDMAAHRAFAFRRGVPLPARCARDLPIETSLKAKSWASFDASEDCHWPLGKNTQGIFLFCGRPRLGKFTAYCAAHDQRSRSRPSA